MPTAVEGAITEITAALGVALPEQEGLTFLTDLPLSSATRSAVAGELGIIGTRSTLLNAALKALQDLLADGYPTVATVIVDPLVIAELADIRAKIADGSNLFEPAGQPASGTVTFG